MMDGSVGEMNVAILSGGLAEPGSGFMLTSNLNENLSEWALASRSPRYAMNPAAFARVGGNCVGSTVPVLDLLSQSLIPAGADFREQT
jgi:hypothetical protein